MKFTVLVISLAVLGLLAGVGCSSSKVPERCCTAKQFEVSFGATIGQAPDTGPVALQEYLLGAFDFNDRKYGMDVYIRQFGGALTHYQVIQLFNKKEMYVIQGGVLCFKMPVGEEPSRCVPDAANYTDSFFLGNNVLLADNWVVSTDPTTGFEGEIYSSTSREDCTPIGVTAVGTSIDAQGNKVKSIESGGYMNFTEGIKDPDHWFVPPPSCDNATMLAEYSSWEPMQHWKRMKATKMFL